MSAAASTVPTTRRRTNLKAACFVPLSYFHQLLDLDYTQLRCFSLITVETIGANRPRAEISLDKFAESFVVSKEWVSTALASLERAGLISVMEPNIGRKTYAIREEYIQEAKNAGRQTIRGRCPDCKTIGEFSTEFIPTPHQALRKLGGCVDSATFRVVMVIVRHTLKWGSESRCIEVDPAELALSDFTRLCGLDDREVINGINQAVELGLIDREKRAGRPSLFWAIPEKFGALERRGPRIVIQPVSGGKKKAKVDDPKKPTIEPKPTPEPETESRPYLYGRCSNCRHLVPVEPVSESEFADAQPKESIQPKKPLARAGPEGQPRSNFPVWEGLDKLKRG